MDGTHQRWHSAIKRVKAQIKTVWTWKEAEGGSSGSGTSDFVGMDGPSTVREECVQRDRQHGGSDEAGGVECTAPGDAVAVAVRLLSPGEANVAGERKALGFDFQREAHAQLKKTCLPILNLLPEKRTKSHISSLLELVKADEFFHDLPADVCEELCHVMRYKQFSTGRTVFQQGDLGTTFYIILSGAASFGGICAPPPLPPVA